MTRIAVLFVALGFVAFSPASAWAQLPGGVQIVDAKVKDGKLIWTGYMPVSVEKEVEVVVMINGQQVKQVQKVVVTELVPIQQAEELKTLKATDGNGKAITADKLAELLKEGTSVVLVRTPVIDKHRKLFKDTTIFVELPGIAPPKGLEPLPPPKG